MVENVKVGESYKFYLTGDKGDEIVEGKVTYKDDEIISLWNADFGEAEFPIEYCACVEPLVMIDTMLILKSIVI